MDITQYLSENKQMNKSDEKLRKNVEILINKEIINEFQYKYLLDFMDRGGTLINVFIINDILILENEYIEKFRLYFMSVYGKIYEIIKNKLVIELNFELTDNQKEAINDIYNFICSDKMNIYGLFGYAGTGKTTLITELIYYLIKNGYINTVIFSAPTNKALNIMKSKINNSEYKINFLTIHKLLNYKNDYTIEGQRIFTKGRTNNFKCDIIIIDECSMIPLQIIKDIYNIINKNRNIKIIFVGDPAQLPPVNEKTSSIFEKNIKSITMNQIVRSNDNDITGICNEIRNCINTLHKPNISKYIGRKIKSYKYEANAINTKWFKTYIKYVKNDEINKFSNIILTWTNESCNNYNESIRKILFKKDDIKEYEVGDILILNDYYNMNILGDKNKFYTSEQIKITEIEESVLELNFFEKNISENKKLHKIPKFDIIKMKFNELIDTLNYQKIEYKVWKLFVHKLVEQKRDTIACTYIIYVIHNDSINKLNVDRDYRSKKIRELLIFYKNNFIKDIEIIEKEIIKPLWKEWNKKFNDPFAKISYGASITTHKSQGSTFCNVFVDLNDILNNNDEDDAKRCLYTALTRASNELHLLI